MKIAIIDYEIGNLANVYNAWRRLGQDPVITRDPQVIREAALVELPGVGAIRDAMANLPKFDLIPLLQEEVKAGKFFMGVCLGMHALFERDFEGGTYDCLGFLPGDVVPFETKLKVPHMGWNELEFRKANHWLRQGLPAIPMCILSIPIINHRQIRPMSLLRQNTTDLYRLFAVSIMSWGCSFTRKKAAA